MPKPSLSEIKSFGDALTTDNFRFEVPLIPGVGVNTKLGIKCQSVNIPGITNERPLKELMGHKVPYRGPRFTGNQLDVTYLEDSRLDTYNTIRGWMDFIVDPITGNGLRKNLHSTVGLLYIFNSKGHQVGLHTFWNVFPIAIQDIPMNGDSVQPVFVHCSFSFDIDETLESLGTSTVNFGISNVVDRLL